MNVLPRLLYLFQTIPICLPCPFFASLNKIFSNFIKIQKKPRIAKKKKTLPRAKTDRGFSGPDLLAYYMESGENRIFDWFQHKDTKLLVNLKENTKKLPKSKLSALSFVASATLFVHKTLYAGSPCHTYIRKSSFSVPTLIRSGTSTLNNKPLIFHYLTLWGPTGKWWRNLIAQPSWKCNTLNSFTCISEIREN